MNQKKKRRKQQTTRSRQSNKSKSSTLRILLPSDTSSLFKYYFIHFHPNDPKKANTQQTTNHVRFLSSPNKFLFSPRGSEKKEHKYIYICTKFNSVESLIHTFFHIIKLEYRKYNKYGLSHYSQDNGLGAWWTISKLVNRI